MDSEQTTNDAATETTPTPATEAPETPQGDTFVDEGDPAKFHEVLMKISESPAEAGDDSGQPANPTSETPEPAKAADSAEQAADPANQAADEELTPEELEQTIKEFQEFLEQRGRTAQAEVEAPSEETQAAAQQAQQQQAQQPQQQPVNPYYTPLTDDDLIEPEKVNAHLDSRFAAQHAEFNQQLVQGIVPFVAQLCELMFVSRDVSRDYPALKGREQEIAMLAGKLRASDSSMDYNAIVESTAKQLMRDQKTANALKKMIGQGVKLDGRAGSPPPGQPQGVKRTASGQFAPADEPDPTAAFVERMKAAYSAAQY